MTRSVRMWCFACVLLFSAPLVHAQCLFPADPRIRTDNPVLLDALSTGVRASPTLRHIVGLVESSDLIVYVVFELPRTRGIAAHVTFISAAGGRRYLHVGIDPHFSGTPLIALLGHELQHAAEIAAQASVVDGRSLAELYRRIGFGSTAGTTEHFESDRAMKAGDHVAREAHAFLAAEERAAEHASR